MTSAITGEWRALKRGKPGRRFQDHYDRGRQRLAGGSVSRRIVRLALAVGAIVVGSVLIFIPGPAILFFIIAGGLLASESRTIALLLDRAEMISRMILTWSRQRWEAASRLGKTMVVLVGVVGLTAASLCSWRILFR